MSFVPVMWTVWGVLVVVMAGLHIYRSSLSRDEDAQVFLDESFDQEKVVQESIVGKVNKVEPYLRVAQWLVLVMTIVVLVYYIRDILIHLNIING
jgi:hypothetical protein